MNTVTYSEAFAWLAHDCCSSKMQQLLLHIWRRREREAAKHDFKLVNKIQTIGLFKHCYVGLHKFLFFILTEFHIHISAYEYVFVWVSAYNFNSTMHRIVGFMLFAGHLVCRQRYLKHDYYDVDMIWPKSYFHMKHNKRCT